MNEFDPKIQRSLDQELDSAGYELIDLVPVPHESDKMRRFRSLQEVLKDFDAGDSGHLYSTYVLQVRKKPEVEFAATPRSGMASTGYGMGYSTRTEIEDPTAPKRARSSADGLYLQGGKLNAPYLLQNAEMLLGAGDFSSAKQIFGALVHEGERMGESLQGLARCLEGEGKLEPALRKYEEAILYQPLVSTFRFHSALLVRLGRFAEAGEVIERTLQSREIANETRLDLYLSAASVWMKGGETLRAEKNLRKAHELDPESRAVNLELGEIALEKSHGDEARAFYSAVLRVQPGNADALFGLGRASLILGDKERAHDLFVQSLEINLLNSKGIFHLVKCAYELKDYERACGILENYIGASPFNPNLLYSLAGLQYHLGRFDDALRTLRQIIAIQPEHVEARNLLAMVEQKLA